MKYLFLLIDLFNIPVAVILSLGKKTYSINRKSFLMPALISGILFSLINSYFTFMGVWEVNNSYITGWHIGNLPVEEILYCLFIPLPLYFSFDYLHERKRNPFTQWQGIDLVFIFCLVNTALYFNQKLFGFFVFGLLGTLLAISKLVCRVKWLAEYYMVCLYSFFPLLMINNLLTSNLVGKPIIVFNNTQMMGTRVYHVPVEMIFYNMALILMNLLIYNDFSQRQAYYYSNK